MKNNYLIIIILVMISLLTVISTFIIVNPFSKEPLVIGLLFSSTGQMAKSEQPIINAVKLATKEINSSGGIHGQPFKLVFYNQASNPNNYEFLAEKLINEDKVKIIIGCWRSSCRKALKPIVEKLGAILIYTNQYEGAEESSNIIYLGATPNQQQIPAINWMAHHYGKRVYLIGSDYIYPHVANEIAKLQINSLGGEIVGTSYIKNSAKHLDEIVDNIIKAKPDFVINNINGENNILFIDKLYQSSNNFSAPTLSFSISDAEISAINSRTYPYMYTAWTYYKSLKSKENTKFLKAYKKAYGSTDAINDPAVTAYSALYMLKNALKNRSLKNALMAHELLLRTSINSPAGVIYIDGFNAHAWRQAMLAKLDEEGNKVIVWQSDKPIQPVVYPRYKTKIEWELFEYRLFIKWNKSWENLN